MREFKQVGSRTLADINRVNRQTVDSKTQDENYNLSVSITTGGGVKGSKPLKLNLSSFKRDLKEWVDNNVDNYFTDGEGGWNVKVS